MRYAEKVAFARAVRALRYDMEKGAAGPGSVKAVVSKIPNVFRRAKAPSAGMPVFRGGDFGVRVPSPPPAAKPIGEVAPPPAAVPAAPAGEVAPPPAAAGVGAAPATRAARGGHKQVNLAEERVRLLEKGQPHYERIMKKIRAGETPSERELGFLRKHEQRSMEHHTHSTLPDAIAAEEKRLGRLLTADETLAVRNKHLGAARLTSSEAPPAFGRKALLYGGLALGGYGLYRAIPWAARQVENVTAHPMQYGSGWSSVPYGYGATT